MSEQALASGEPALARGPGRPPKVELFPVKLLKNYVPTGKHEIVGYTKAAVRQKNAAGQWVELEPEKFMTGEAKPPAYPGAGYANKIWAGTHIRLPVDEAKTVIAKRIAERADELPG